MQSIKEFIRFVDLTQLFTWSVQGLLDANFNYSEKYELARIGDFLIRSRNVIDIDDDRTYKRVTVRINNKGVLLRDAESGKNIGTKKQYLARAGQFIVSKIDARNGAFGIIPDEIDGSVVTNDFPLFNVNEEIILPHFLLLVTTTKKFISFAQSCSSGTTNRQRMDIDLFLDQRIPLPSINEQGKIIREYDERLAKAELLKVQAQEVTDGIVEYIFSTLGINRQASKVNAISFQLVEFVNLREWGVDKIMADKGFEQARFPYVSIEDDPNLALEMYRGKSPVYSDKSEKFILNQKCNRWNNIDLTFVKNVDEDWLNEIDKVFFTREGDILINSTGEGTIGRATCIKKGMEGLLYDSHILLLRLNKQVVLPEFFVEIFNSEIGQRQVDALKSAQATKQTELGINNLRKIKIPLPPQIEEQRRFAKVVSNKRESIVSMEVQRNELTKLAISEFEKVIFEKL